MKRIICIFLVLCTLFALIGCGSDNVIKKPSDGENEKGEDTPHGDDTDGGDEIINSDTDFSDMPKLDEMNTIELRKAVVPYLEAWYNFYFKQMWWSALKLSPSHESYTDKSGSEYFLCENLHSKDELKEYLGAKLKKELYEDLIDSYTVEVNGGLYVLGIATGWFGEPDFNSCTVVGKTNNSFQIAFDEMWGMSEQSLRIHVVNLIYSGGAFKVDGNLNSEEAAKVTLDALLASELSWELMTVSEFHHFVSLLLLNESFSVANMSYDDSTITRYPDRETEEDQCVAYAMINGNACFVTIGKDKDNDGKIGILSIDLM